MGLLNNRHTGARVSKKLLGTEWFPSNPEKIRSLFEAAFSRPLRLVLRFPRA